MKTSTGDKVKLGLFILIGLLLFGAGIYLIGKSKNVFGTTFRVSSIFNNVSGLLVGNNVRYSGINVGTVESITIISDSTVRVDMIIENRLRKHIKKDSKATIGSEGLMGNKIINITPGAPYSEPIKYNDIIESIRPMETDEVLKTLLVTANNAREISEDLNAILSSIRSGKGAVGTLLMDKQFADNLRQMMNNLNKGTSGFESTMDNVKKGTEAFNENMEAAKHSILFRGYFKKKEKKEAEKEMTEEEIEKESKRIDNAQARQRERNDRK